MPDLLSCQQISKSYRARFLFKSLSFAVGDRERLGLIGPNGSGKSTLLKIMAGLVDPDEGSVALRKQLRVGYLAQDDVFKEATVDDVLVSALKPLHLEEHEVDARVQIMLTKCGLTSGQQVSDLSGGWRKRLSIARQLVTEMDLLLLDEPTNHLDLAGVMWLEELLKESSFAFVVVSHDRNFLENISNRMVELNAVYADGFLSVNGTYSDFLVAREEYLGAQANLEQQMASKARREIAWLKRGARARQTKAQGRIRDAEKLFDNLAEVKFRNAQTGSVDIDFNASGRKTKELLVAKGISKKMGERTLFQSLNVHLAPGTRLGVLGTNGSGKTTLLRIFANALESDTGTIKRADQLRVVWFDQNRQQLDKDVTLWQALCPIGDSVCYRGRNIHVSTWAKRFLFKVDQLQMPVSHLSGGEQARILIANLMLQPADILILDEPTNDLDIPSLEVLEDSLLEFPGALVLVTHDRFMLSTVSNTILALHGDGSSDYFASYEQWEDNQQSRKQQREPSSTGKPKEDPLRKSRALSTSEKKELDGMEAKIALAEQELDAFKKKMEDKSIASDHLRLAALMKESDEMQEQVNQLYARWQELEERAKQ